jgi:hypothetical protein
MFIAVCSASRSADVHLVLVATGNDFTVRQVPGDRVKVFFAGFRVVCRGFA